MKRPQTTHPCARRARLEADHLRLVRIMPGPADALICCETRTLPVWSPDNRYIAVSYAWGPPVEEHAIVLDGQIHLLAKNLWHFLQIWRSSHALKSSSGRPPHSSTERARTWLWVDALCINQTDVGERMHQVKAMSRIFAGAEKVLVWLGRATAGMESKTCDLFGALYYTRQRGYWRRDDVRKDVCGRPYWGRLWVFQELKSARAIELMCGTTTMGWDWFGSQLMGNGVYSHRADEFISDAFDFDQARQSAAATMLMLCSRRMPTSLWTLLQLTSHLHCYDPRDKVYALLSIARTGADGIDADYAMPLPQLMHLVLRNFHSSNSPQSVHHIAIQCERLKAMMGLESDSPWCADDYLAAADQDLVVAVQGCHVEI